MQNENISSEFINKFWIELDNVNGFSIGDYNIVCVNNHLNKYDMIAYHKNIEFCSNPEVEILSSYYRVEIEYIKKMFRPIDGTGINLWLINKDYSNDSRFECYFRIEINSIQLKYELADFLI